jgi:hypothetical protein
MGILLAFAPFIVFAILDRLIGANVGLLAAAVTSAIFIVRDVITPGRSAKLLEIGTFVLFAGLALYAWAGHAQWSLYGARVWVDSGLLLIVLLTMLIGRPFTLQYAREQINSALWSSPTFVRTNYVLTAAWAVAFLVLVLADLLLLKMPSVPKAVGIVIIVAALYGAFKFTSWYPERVRARLPTNP